MPIGIKPGEIFDYVLKDERDKPTERQTIFKIKILTEDEDSALQDRALALITGEEDEREMRAKSGTSSLGILKKGLVGWENFKDHKGNDIPFSLKNLGYLDLADRIEIGNAITDRNVLSEDDEKNSESAGCSE